MNILSFLLTKVCDCFLEVFLRGNFHFVEKKVWGTFSRKAVKKRRGGYIYMDDFYNKRKNKGGIVIKFSRIL